MWDLETIRRINEMEARRQRELINIREEMRRKQRREFESETFEGRIAQSYQEDQFDREGVDE